VRDSITRSAEAKKFLSELYAKAPQDWFVELTLLKDRRAENLVFPIAELERDWDEIFRNLSRINTDHGANVHHGVNPRFRRPERHGKNEDVSAFVALWIDVDIKGDEEAIRKRFDEAVASLREAGIPPSVIVDSGHGLHAYWLLDQPYPVEEARPCCAGVMDFFKISDPIHDPRRLLRVPGFLNVKDPKNPKECRIVDATWARYPLEAFKDFAIDLGKNVSVPAAALESPETDQDLDIPETPSRDPRIEEAKKGVAEGAGPYGGRHNAAVALAGHYSSNRQRTKSQVLRALHAWNAKNTPPLPQKEINDIVDNVWAKEQLKREEEPPRKKKKKEPLPPWLDEGWRPSVLAAYVTQGEKYLATPISDDGRGVKLLRYENGVYRPGSSFARSVIDDFLGADSSESRIRDVLNLILERKKCPYKDVNKNADELINVKNGMLRWSTGELLPHDPKYLSLVQIPVAWDPNAKSEMLDEFLNAVLPPDALQTAEEMIGYLLLPDTSFAKGFVLVGEGGNGKSTFLTLVEALLGEENVSNFSLHALVEERFTAAGLFGKLANFYDELELRALEDTATFKQIVAGSPIKAEEKFCPAFHFKPHARLVFATNRMPRATDRSQGFFERLIFLVFANKFRHTKGEILNYGKVLVETPGVLPALLVRAVAGLRRLKARNSFEIPKSSLDALDDYQRECDSGIDFVREYCERAADDRIAKASLYEYYKHWCEAEGRKTQSAREFNRTVQQAMGAKEVRRDNVRFWEGIRWKDNGEPPRIGIEEIERFGNGNERLSLDF
jgi:putative DNA primase/helicase